MRERREKERQESFSFFGFWFVFFCEVAVFSKKSSFLLLLFFFSLSLSLLAAASSHGASLRLPPPGNGPLRRSLPRRASRVSGKERGERERGVDDDASSNDEEKKKTSNAFFSLSFSSPFPLSLLSSTLPQAVSKRIQNAKSNKFFGNIHKRGLVQNTAQVRVGGGEKEKGKTAARDRPFWQRNRDAPFFFFDLPLTSFFLSLSTSTDHLPPAEEKGHQLQRRPDHARLLPVRRRGLGAAPDHPHGDERGAVLRKRFDFFFELEKKRQERQRESSSSFFSFFPRPISFFLAPFAFS